jgi:predicted aspartyl protease
MPGVRVLLAIAVWLAAAPALASPAPEPPPEAVVGVLPFEASDEPNRVMVNLAPEGGRPFVMMLATGASDSVVTPQMARELGVSVRRNKSTPYRRATRLGTDVQFWIDTRRSDTAARTRWEYGQLGAEFLNDFVVEIDFPGRTVRFLDPKAYEVPAQADAPGERVLDVEMTSSRPLVPIQLNGKHTTALLDTAIPLTGLVSGASAREAGIELDSLPEFGGILGVIGATKARVYEEAQLGLAGFPLGPVPLLVAPKGWYNQAPNDSGIGYDALAPFVIRIDYPRKRLWLKRVVEGPIRFAGADYALAKRTGAYLLPAPGGWAVWGVAPASAAEKLGVRAGDVIVSPASSGAPPADEVLRQILEGKELQVSRKQGELWVDTVLPEPQATD